MFRFRLSTLLRLRTAERDERRADLAKALQAEAILREQQQRLTAEQGQLVERSRQLKAPGAADVDALLHAHRYELVLAARRRQLAGQLEQVQAEIERRRQALVEADRQVRVLEKLRERQQTAYAAVQTRHEIKQYDEMATIGHVRRQEVRP
jgi:flagellar FliJ protein